MLLTNNNQNVITNKKQLIQVFQNGCKTDEKTGVEYEKLLVYKHNLRAVVYEDVVKILECFSNNDWQKIYEGGNLIGLKGKNGVISLEPGSQIELSLTPLKSLDEISEKLNEFYNELNIYANNQGAMILDSGIQPVSTFENIYVIPKKRYEYMTKYLPLRKLTPYVMMRETAGIQANFDYKSEEDAINKLSLALKMSPFISAIYSNSPVRNSKNTGYKSYRANSWLNVDENRCGIISPKLFEKNLNFSFSDYAEILLDVPMIFIKREEEYYGTTQTFREFMNNGYMGLRAEISDWENHISLYFPDVRLKSYIEIRNHDAQNMLLTLSVPAFWKGIMYNSKAMEEITNILNKFSYEDFINLRKNTPILGINTKIGDTVIIDYIKEFFDISYESLKSNGLEEEKYLEPVLRYVNSKRMPADDLIENFNSNSVNVKITD